MTVGADMDVSAGFVMALIAAPSVEEVADINGCVCDSSNGGRNRHTGLKDSTHLSCDTRWSRAYSEKAPLLPP